MKNAKGDVRKAQQQVSAFEKSIKEYSLNEPDFADFLATLTERRLCIEAFLGGTIKVAESPDGSKAEDLTIDLCPELKELQTTEPSSTSKQENPGANGKPSEADVDEVKEDKEAKTPEEEDTNEEDTTKHLKKKKEEPTDDQEKKPEEGKPTKACVHKALVTAAFANLTFLPIESRDMKSATELEDMLTSVSTFETLSEIEATSKAFENQEHLLKQLGKSLGVAINDLKKASSSEVNNVKAGLTAGQLLKKEAQHKSDNEKEAGERRKLASLKVAGPFKIAWTDHGHSKIRTFPDDQALQASDDKVSKPWIVHKSCAFAELFAMIPTNEDQSDVAALKRTLSRWHKQFPNASECTTDFKVVAPLLPVMGSDCAVSLFNKLFGERVVSKLPSYHAIAENVLMFGALQDSCHFGREANSVATLRAQYAGATDVLAISGTGALKLIKEVWKKDAPTWDLYDKIFTHISQADAVQCKEKGITIWTGTVAPGDVLYVPAGFTTATRMRMPADAAQHTAAMKFGFLASKDLSATAEVLSALIACNPNPADLKVINLLQDVVALAQETATPAPAT